MARMAIGGGCETMPARTEVRGDRAVGGEEALRVPWTLEAPHPALPLACRLVGILRAVVPPFVLPVLDARQDLPLGCPIAGELIRDDDARYVREILEQQAEELLGGGLIQSALDQDVEHIPVLVDGAPEIVLIAVDRNEHLVQAPFVASARATTAQRIRVGLAERT